ncbi:MAG: hypothetical protein IID37_05005, partial [Planctomycetes bacterium]|nr:hypothetical protein [Planctomycetota bacterium]
MNKFLQASGTISLLAALTFLAYVLTENVRSDGQAPAESLTEAPTMR